MTSPSPLPIHSRMMERLKNKLDTMSHLVGSRKIAYLDYPMYGNVGDLLIMEGTLSYFERHRTEITTSMTAHETMRRRIPLETTIVLQGGGNFGDLYPLHQEFRESVVRQYPDHRILVFPQTIYFQSEERFAKTCDIFSRHPDLHLFCRDVRSFELARTMTDHAVLMPDMAHYLWGRFLTREDISSGASKPFQTLALLRTDKEKHPDSSAGEPFDRILDWPSLVGRRNSRIGIWKKLWKLSRRAGAEGPLADRIRLNHWRRFTLQLIEEAVAQFVSAERIVTDRLHGHILASLLSIRHRFHDTLHGKISDYYKVWTYESPLAQRGIIPSPNL